MAISKMVLYKFYLKSLKRDDLIVIAGREESQWGKQESLFLITEVVTFNILHHGK